MLTLKRLNCKRSTKKDKQLSVLLGVVDLFIKTSKPIGSNTLKETGFDFLSSATIRNYFANLEETGYLKQQHSSGGRIPTSKAFRAYANATLENLKISSSEAKKLSQVLKNQCKKVTTYLHKAADHLSEISNSCVFLLSPSFDQDFIQNIKLIPLYDSDLLCVIITDFGQIKTEILNLDKPLKDEEIKLLEKFLLWRINKGEKPILTENITKAAQKIYNEIMLRHVARYSSQTGSDSCYKTGLSKLLIYPEFQDPTILVNSLSLFEDFEKIKTLLFEAMKLNKLTCWIGDELAAFGTMLQECAIITFPYKINNLPAGAIALLLPQRTDYAKVFAQAMLFSEYISEALTKSIYKFKINFQPSAFPFSKQHARLSIMLEDKSKIQEKK